MKAYVAESPTLRFIFLCGLATFCGGNAKAQMEHPGPEMEVLKKDVGEWECEIKTWPAPGAEPTVSKGAESNRMLGGHWLVVNFSGEMMGMKFQGHGNYGYDKKNQKYIGTWIDSMGPLMMHTEGTYEKETETLTMVGDSLGPDGASMYTYTMSTSYKDGGRVMTMYMQPQGSGEDKKLKFFEITYNKKP